MIRPLRKYHIVVWHVLALLLPLGFIMAIAFRPPVPVDTLSPDETFVTYLEAGSDSTSILTVVVTRPLTVPSCLVYNQVDGRNVLLGAIHGQGTYPFVLTRPYSSLTVKLYDAIGQDTIATITITGPAKN
jgi:hypothetical protein